MAEEKTTDKRVKISKAQQQTMLVVLVTSLVLGFAVVMSIYFVKMIFFDAKVLGAQNDSIDAYNASLTNVKKLASNVTVDMATNEDLESVGRESLEDCYDEEGKKKDYAADYEAATTTSDKAYQLSLMKMCSSLRVIPDALPAQENDEALLASLNEIFLQSEWEPESLSPSGSAADSTIEGLETIPVSLAVEADTATTTRVLANIEKSIRAFDVQTATISWAESGLNLRAQMTAYYTEEISATEKNTTVRAKETRKTRK